MRASPLAATVAALWLGLAGASLWLILQTPWLGLQLVAGAQQDVAIRAATGPALGKLPGDAHLTGIREPGGAWLAVLAADLNPEPTQLHSYAQLHDFFARQDLLHAVLRAPQVELRLGGGQIVTVASAPSRPLGSVPVHVWVQFGFAALLFLVTANAAVRAPRDMAARMLLLAAIGSGVCFFAHAVYSARELAIPAERFRLLLSLNHVMALALGGGCANLVLWYFPRPLGSARGGLVIVAIGAALAIAGELRLAPTLNLGFRLPLLGMFAGTACLAVVQWRRAAGRPLHRAMLRWLMLPWIIGVGLYAVLTMIPVAAGLGPYASQTLGWGFLTLIGVGLGLGVTRFRLFYLNPANLWVWGLTGAICALLVYALQQLLADPWIASCLGLATAGVVYFPIRELLWKVQPFRRAKLETVLESITDRAVGTTSLADVTQGWHDTLIDVFRPMEVQASPGARRDATLIDGETLDVSIAATGERLRLLRPFGGRSLFSPGDETLARAVGALFTALANYWSAHERGERRERAQLAEMLRTRLRGRLSDMRARVTAPELANLLALAELRLDHILSALGTTGCALDQAIAAWRESFVNACRAAGVSAEVVVVGVAGNPQLAEAQMIAASRLVQEATANIVRHSTAATARLTIGYAAGALDLTVEDDGRAQLKTLEPGRGLKGLRERSQALGGTLLIAASPLGGLALRQTIRLDPTAGAAASVAVPCSGDTLPARGA